MKNIIITGYTSSIAVELTKIIKRNTENVNIINCGRGKESDLKIDFSKINNTKKFINFLVKKKPSYLFLNHGFLPGKKILDCSEKIINDSCKINLISYLMIFESLIKIKNLNTVSISSVSGKAGSFDTLYASTKNAVDFTVKVLSKKIDRTSRINCVSPGIIYDAKMTLQRKNKKILEIKKNQTPTKKFTSSFEVANMVYYLLFNTGNINGENININGGIC
tara:strand:+ start:327 stop:989 length:663 start_codon:yes stop_codon:yes gene_type:complete